MRTTVKILAAAPLVVIAAAAAVVSWQSRSDGIPLAVRWEGAVIDRNFRDVGTSLNSCLGRPLFRAGVLLRANVWFSGWSCEGVGDPDVILSLNFDPRRNERYFCRDADGRQRIGEFYNPTRHLADLEFVETWSDPVVAEAACGFVRAGLAQIGAGARVLAHCDAGKDRTGTYAALLPAAVAEERGRLDAELVEALECDYRKSRSLEAHKHGRITAFLAALQQTGGVGAFLAARCGIERQEIRAVGARLISE
jgi:hypothetical protein